MSETSERQRAEARLRAAELAAAKIDEEMRGKRDEAIAVIEAQLRDEYAERARSAQQERIDAARALDDARIADYARRGPAIGARYVESRRNRYSREVSPTGRVAVVEQRTRESQFSANRRWSVPAIGTKFLRILKKDGTPGLQFAHLGDWDWKPEGDK